MPNTPLPINRFFATVPAQRRRRLRTAFVVAAFVLAAPVATVRAQQNTTPPPPANTKVAPAVKNPSAQPTPASEANELFQQGVTAFRRGDLAEAQGLVIQAADKDPANGDAQSWAGYLLAKNNDPVRAIPYLEKAITLRPSAPEGYTNLGNALFAKTDRTPDETTRAIDVFKKAAELAPTSSEAQHNLGFAYSRIAQYPQAADAYRKATELNAQDATAWSNLGFALQKGGDNNGAAEAYQKAVDLKPQDGALLANLGAVELARGNAEAATTALDAATKLEIADGPTRYAALINLGRVRAGAKQWTEAAEAFGSAAALVDDGVVPSAKQDPTARYNQGVALERLGKYDDASTAYDAALTVSPRYFDALVNSGTTRYRLQNFEGAQERFLIATEITPTSALAWSNLGAVYSRRGDLPNAIVAWRKAASLKPDDSETRQFLALALATEGKPEEAIRYYKEAARLGANTKGMGAIYNSIGLSYYKMGKLNPAFDAYTEAIRREPNNSSAHNNRGVVYEKRGQVVEAVAEYRKAIALDRNNQQARQNLARYGVSASQTGSGGSVRPTLQRRSAPASSQPTQVLPAPPRMR